MRRTLRPVRARSLLAVAVAALALAAACEPPPPPPPSLPASAGAPDASTFGCPVLGATYSSTSYGPRAGSTFHYGVDMFAAVGTSETAVGAGRVTYEVESAGGNAAYLWADDGNVYYYAHMSAFVGTNDRRVAKGDSIGLLGQTGNATAPHLHFEIRIGGANGTRIDPYPTLHAAGC